MRLLFEIDKNDYEPNAERIYHKSSCGIVIRGKTIAMCYVDKHGVYVIPGGGIEAGETVEQTVIREMHEETGLRIIPESIREYGVVRTIKKGKYEPIYVQDDFYFLCQAAEEIDEVSLTENEQNSGFRFEFINPFEILRENDNRLLAGDAPCLFERERRLLLKLTSEEMFEDDNL